VEWTLYFKNNGTADTSILANIKALDASFTRPAEGEFLLHGNKGDFCTVDSYEPWAEPLPPNAKKQFAPGRRPAYQPAVPVLECRDARQRVHCGHRLAGAVVGRLRARRGHGLRIRAGQELTHFVLHPGEEVRSPLAVVQFYEGDWLRAQNVWRRWMIGHNIPRVGGEPPKPFTSICIGLQQSERNGDQGHRQLRG